MVENVTVVIRAAGERTEQLCYDLICRQVPEKHVFLIHESPFSKAVERTFEIGIKQNNKWTLAVDADVLLRKDAIRDLVALAERQEEIVFEVQGHILDKLFKVPKPGGPHLCRTSLLEKALHLVPPDGRVLRPESYVFRTMTTLGYPLYQGQEIFGLHDYEQFYKDIYRKAYVHGIKFKNRIPYLTKTWKKYVKDNDYQVALKGLKHGKKNVVAWLDIKKLSFDINSILEGHLSEKPPIHADIEEMEKKIYHEIKVYKPEKYQQSVYSDMLYGSWSSNYEHKYADATTLRKFLYRIGNRFVLIGDYIKKVALK